MALFFDNIEFRNAQKLKYAAKIKNEMQAAGTYRSEFDRSIRLLADSYVDLESAELQFEESGGKFIKTHKNKIGAENAVKNPSYQIVQDLRDCVMNYSRELGLTPQGLKKLIGNFGTDGKESEFEKAMKELSSG